MKAAKTLIAWTPARVEPISSPRLRAAPPGSVGISPLLRWTDSDWTSAYYCTGGAAEVHRRKLFGRAQQFEVMMEWYALVYGYGLSPYVVHRAFLLIDEYQSAPKARGWGPARDEPGHDPNIGHGRAISVPPPEIDIHYGDGATHFWPTKQVKPSDDATLDRIERQQQAIRDAREAQDYLYDAEIKNLIRERRSKRTEKSE